MNSPEGLASPHHWNRPGPLRIALYGRQADVLADLVAKHDRMQIGSDAPDVVVCYGGDGTLLAAEMNYPGIPKVPILNSTRGHRCIPHPADEVLEGLANGTLVANTYDKLGCSVRRGGERTHLLTALNEVNVHMGRINSAVRFKMWLNEQPYEEGREILGDGFLACTPFGSTAYFNKITRGVFNKGIGVAFKATTEHTSHLVVPAEMVIRFLITRGPATLAYDSAQDYVDLKAKDELIVAKHAEPAVILTCGPVKRLDEPF
jgi:NAD+ kinase